MNRLYRGLVLALLFFIGGLWLSYRMAKPLFILVSELEVVRFGWIGLPIVGTYAFTGLLGVVAVALLLSIKHHQQIMKGSKFVLIPTLLFGIFGLGINYANYFLVVKPNGLVLCPEKLGYAKKTT